MSAVTTSAHEPASSGDTKAGDARAGDAEAGDTNSGVAEEVAPLPEPEVPDVESLELAATFPTAQRADWQRLVRGVLVKGRRLGEDATGEEAEAALSTTIADGITVRALYTRADELPAPGLPGVAPYTRGRLAVRDGWDVRPLHEDPDPAVTHRSVLDDLEGGAGSIWLRLGGAGLSVDALARVLEGVYLELAPVVLDAGAETAAAAAAFFAVATANGVADEALLGGLGADPLGLAAATGGAPDLSVATSLATRCAQRHPGVRAVTVDALPYADAGATDGQELGLALATGVAYLRALTDAGLSVEAACAQLEFRYAATSDQFATIAKLRAARRLWSRVTELSGVAAGARGQRQHAVTSWSMMTRFDSHTNLLRSTIAAFAAGVGGADAVTVLPFDTALGLPDDFSRRIARNTSALLVEESHVAAVTDPAGGSWAVEALTDDLAKAGWAVFQEIEVAGGMAAALASGGVADRLAASSAQRSERLATGRDSLVGVTDFPDLAERVPDRRPAPARAAGGLPRARAAEPLERLRLRAAAAAERRAQVAYLVAVGTGKPAAAAVTRIGTYLRPGGVEPVRVTADSLPEDLGGGVAILCHAPDADEAELSAARTAAETAGAALVLDSATVTTSLQLLERVLGVTDPDESTSPSTSEVQQ